MREVLDKVVKGLQPRKGAMKKVESVVKKINLSLKKKEINAECIVGGSFAKDTHLKEDHDVDLFVKFDYEEYKDEDISKMLEKALPFKASKINGSRDYYQFRKEKMDFEVVPVLKINKEKPKNVTDMSPKHVDFVTSHVKKKPGLNDEIRLLKQFCKANKVYGAESYIQGLSGHVLDILVLYYGSFEKVILASAFKWGDRVVIDMESHWKNPLKELNKSKIQSPMVIVDPVQPDRNAAAAVSEDKFELFKKKCREFANNPGKKFFEIKNIDIHDLHDSLDDKHELVFVEAYPYKGKNDVMGAKMRQVYDYIYNKILDYEWPILESDWEFLKGKEPVANMYFIMAKKVAPFTERKGPPIIQKDDVKKFTKTHSNTFVRGGRVYAKIERRHNVAEELVDDVLWHKYVSERVKKKFLVEV